jgi:hypothetical protein
MTPINRARLATMLLLLLLLLFRQRRIAMVKVGCWML